MDGDVVQFDVIGDFTIWFLGSPGEEVFGFGDGASYRFVFVVAHVYLLGWIWFNNTGRCYFSFLVFRPRLRRKRLI